MGQSVIPDKLKKQRTLAAIVFTDGVNFSARMSVNEEHTLELIRRDLALMRELCEQQFEGHVLKSTGDGLLMYFSSAVQAVSCALDIQKQLADRAVLLPPSGILTHRIGIHLGDVFITENDVMGNGVNIAARLQAEAEPGTVCISQTVYDVVRASLALNATYLGPLTLKNIQEAIPAYQLCPFLEDELGRETVSYQDDVSTSPLSMQPQLPTPLASTQDLYHEVVRSIRNDPNLVRIKKLLLCVCRNHWETDPAQLEQVDLWGLVQEMYQLYPTLDELTFGLERVVSSLSKPEQYRQVANAVARHVKLLYPDEPEPPTDFYSTIAQTLANHKDAIRVKKLLYCVWTDQWESDPSVLDRLDLRHLLREVHAVAPTLNHLTQSLSNIVRTLSKPDAYALVANTIAAQFSKLYLSTPQTAPSTEETISLTMVSRSPIDLIPRMNSAGDRSSPSTLASSEATYVVASATDVFSAVTEPATVQGQAPMPTEQPSVSANRANELATLTIDDYLASIDIQAIKQTVISYAIPMRAKILAYSVLYQKFNFNAHDWSLIRQYRLSDLLLSLVRKFDTLSDMETRLEILAHCLEEPDEYLQVAGVISQAMEHIYQTRPQNLRMSEVQVVLPMLLESSTEQVTTSDANTTAEGLATVELSALPDALMSSSAPTIAHPPDMPLTSSEDDLTRQL
ncbi:MAG: adenylate/guanylate cyclase domain-containing protein [Cyanobacteria bacterium]|nr:adenylate/guanylate cyclase domain-containing protein [Cyanobacteriota bacterium]MDW8201162.1 adenylate/guanylate cyclase domain-containing protein [Cyanobacteriota bacterium SKYGB_h_bin112]